MNTASRGILVLEVLGESGPGTPLPDRGSLVIGSSADQAGLVLAGAGVAGAHCAVGRVKGGGWALKDLGSRAGTEVNGSRVASVRLSHGDVIAVGSRRLRVVDPARPRELVLSSAPAAGGRPAAPRTGSSDLSDLGDLPPARIGGFRVERRLGRGGMGEVYLAVQESLGRPVALKVLSARLDADHDFVERFLSEARAAAALNHTNVVVVYDVGEADGHHYLAMEYMDRGSLEERVAAGGALPWREALDVLYDAASGLVYAESKGIVHRDIKPANLMQNSAGATKIADLGLATQAEAEERDAAERKVYGTPHFISPEQARGGAVDHRSDLYSLGATMYRLLSGHTPFEGGTTRDILRAHFSEEPRPIEEWVPEIPGELAELVTGLLAKAPDDRPRSAASLLESVGRLRLQAAHGAVAACSRSRPTLSLIHI